MLKRLTRRFVVLFVLLAALVPLSSNSATPTRRGLYCYRTVDDFGYCAMVCCDSNGNCTMYSCTV
jgi:hypothetical protein